MNTQLFQQLFQRHDAIMLLLDPITGLFLASNLAANRFYGYTAAQMKHLNIHQINMLPAAKVAQIQQAALQENCNSFIVPHRLASGEIRMVKVHASPIMWENSSALFAIIHDITERKQLETELHVAHEELQRAYDETLEGWVQALDLRDRETEGHSRRVMTMMVQVAQLYGLPESELPHIRRGALLHDIGKLGIPDHILLKPAPLDDMEWQIMKLHPVYAYQILRKIDYLKPALDIPYSHHEKWDGTGYPCGLKGEEIPLVARLFALVDVYDALSSHRPYRQAWPKEKITGHIIALAGSHFDPQLVPLFLQLI